MEDKKDLIKDVIRETIEELQSLLQEGDRLTITPKSARLVRWGKVKALGTLTVVAFLEEGIQLRQAAIFYKADKEYGSRIAQGLKLDLKEVEKLANMSQEERVKATS